ncbi:uncharacterized protein LOC126373003 [Pectinophora gossypiella]|uniref:uncharacterized protein LOC126373003 n=1 Tax=Pectinophora gossypiella TaxID=13191 RepID=UPI00214E0380|nr:uncharacterized protein LOC126373003 [Pectinophora gossypiella]
MCFVVRSFCCYISVEVGAQVICIISMLVSAALTVLYSSAAVFLQLSQTKLVLYCGMALAAGLQGLSAGLLGCGAFQRRPALMWPWLLVVWATGGSLLVVSVVGTAALILGGALSADVNTVIFAYVIYSLFLLYCAAVVNSRRRELVKEREYTNANGELMRPASGWKYA